MFIVPARKCLPDNVAPSGQVSAAIHLQIDQDYRVISLRGPPPPPGRLILRRRLGALPFTEPCPSRKSLKNDEDQNSLGRFGLAYAAR
jgi:hypothetical protein